MNKSMISHALFHLGYALILIAALVGTSALADMNFLEEPTVQILTPKDTHCPPRDLCRPTR